VFSSPPPALESLRLQLEGRWEHIEQARERYTQLSRRLSAFQWKRALRGQPELLKQAREREGELTEVLTYVEHRASLEQWPKDHPGRVILQELRARRAKLEALVRKRLAAASFQDGASFVEALGQLEVLAREPLPQPPGPGEPVLFEDWLFSGSSPGRVWLTPERLLWQPWLGEPVQVPLDSPERNAITLLPGWIGLHVKRQRLTLFSLSYAEPLASLLQFCFGIAHLWHERPQVLDLVTCPAYLHHQNYGAPSRWGLGVFLPTGLAFLPASHRTLLDLCRSLVGIGARRPGSVELRRLEALVEHLRRLPSHEFNVALRELVHAREGKFWPSSGLHRLVAAGSDLRLQAREQVVVVADDERRDHVHEFLARHPPAGVGQAKVSWWRTHYKEKVGIVAGLALHSTAMMHVLGSPPEPEQTWLYLLFLGQGLLAWACSRYAKALGHPALFGLVASIMCPTLCSPAMLLLLGPSPKKEPPRSPEERLRG
jgi:hypothetical protein